MTMKVVMLGKWPTGTLSGGVAVHTVNLVKELSELKGLKLHMVSFSEDSEILNEGKTKINLIKTKKIYYILPFIALFKLWSEIKDIKPDIIHLQGSNISPYLIYTLFLARNKKIVITLHSNLIQELLAHEKLKVNSLRHKIIKFVVQYTFKRADRIISVGSSLKESIIKESNYDISNKVVLLPNGVDTNLFDFKIDKKKVRDKLNISKKDFIIFHAKSFVPNNGQRYLIKAFNTSLKSFPNSKLILAGEGPLKQESVELCKKLGISNNVMFLGDVPHNKIPFLMAASDLVVIPSISINKLEESSCILALEAMAMKKPVIATNIGGLKDSIINGKTGILVNDKNPDEISININKLINNSLMNYKLSKNAFNYIKNERKWTKIAEDTLNIYEFLSISDQH